MCPCQDTGYMRTKRALIGRINSLTITLFLSVFASYTCKIQHPQNEMALHDYDVLPYILDFNQEL